MVVFKSNDDKFTSKICIHEIDLKEQFAESKRQGVNIGILNAFRFLRMAHTTPAHVTGRGYIRNIQVSGTKPFIQRMQMGVDELELDYAGRICLFFLAYAIMALDEGKPILNADGKVIGHCIYNQPVDEVIILLED